MRQIIGCLGGIVLYGLAWLLNGLLNVHRPFQPLPEAFVKDLKRLFPHIDFSKVGYKDRCLLPGSLVMKGKVAGMAFGNRVYFSEPLTTARYALLVHELVHVGQFQQRNQSWIWFGCDYGRGYMQYQSYRKNPMEVEAYDFVDMHLR